MSSPRLLAFLPLVLAVLAGCHSDVPAAVSATGTMTLAVYLPESLPAEVSRVTLTVSGSDMASLSMELAVTDGAWRGVVADIPAGPNRTFLAQAFTSAQVLRYQGQVDGVTVPVGSMGLVSLTLQDVLVPPPFSNEAPIVDSLVASATRVAPGGSLSLTATARDPNPGDTLTYLWSAPSGSFDAPTQAHTTWTAPTTRAPVQLTLQVSDSRGASLSMRLTVEVSPDTGAGQVHVDFNTAPRIGGLTVSHALLDVGQQTVLSVSASDADGDGLRYQWTASCPGSFAGATAASATFTPSALPQSPCNNCQLLVTVMDGRGGTHTGSVAVCVAKESRRAPPSITLVYQSSLTANANQQLTFEVGASDPEGSALGFVWTATHGTLGTASTGANGSRMTWTAPVCVASGVTPGLTVTVNNASGGQATRSFRVTGLPACAPPGYWTRTGSLNKARHCHSSTLLSTGKVLVSGGINSVNGSYAYLPTAELYDPATGAWSPTGSMASTRYSYASIRLSTGKVLVAGGEYGGGNGLAAAELYDPATGTWSPTGSMLYPRYHQSAVQLSTGKVLVLGGHGNGTYLVTAELYDPATGTWRLTGSTSSPRYQASVVLLSDGRVLVVGGSNGSVGMATAELYDPATGTWSPTGSMSVARVNHSLTLLPTGKVLVAGGYSENSYRNVATAELYDPATGTWRATGSMSTARAGHQSLLLPNGKVLASGAGSNGSDYQATAELYDPGTGLWVSTGSMSFARSCHTMTLLPNGQVLSSGGNSSPYTANSVAPAEVYSAETTP